MQISNSILRTALINWYPFVDGKRALLLGSNIEPLRLLLDRHFDTVDSIPLEELQGNPLSSDRKTYYDCIVAADLVEVCEGIPQLLQQLHEVLAVDGVLLLAFRNRFGLKYLCGGTDGFVKTPFATLQRVGTRQRLYARGEMETMLCNAGFARPRCYFLMPDADFVQAVYTDDYLPNDSIRDRVFPFNLYDSPLIAWEGDLYDDIVREGTLPYTANVYLEECRKPGAAVPIKQVIYAALSTDRGTEHGFATVLYSDGTACKLPLGLEGMKSLEILYANMEVLKARKILTVEYKMTDKCIEMPLIHEEGLMHYLRRQLPDHPEVFLAALNQIYQDVLLSSPLAENCPEGMSEIWGSNNEKLEPVLKTGWIDMIPYNAFWADGRIRYYDQEFAILNCPAKFVLFRALHYTWIHIPEAEKALPLEKVKEHFGLTVLWDGFQRYEDRFVEENRNWKSFNEIYSHALPDCSEITMNRAMLDPLILLNDVHSVQLELLKELDRVCREYGLQYMAIHGTLLGAVRHHGFIPWDDDVDIAMPRKDYDILLSLKNSGFAPGFFLQTPLNNYGCFYGGYSKLRRDGTAIINLHDENTQVRDYHHGICIDIFPLDICPEKKKTRKKLQNRLAFLQRIVYAKTYPLSQFVPKDVPGSKVSLYYLLAKCIRRRNLLERIDRICRNQNASTLRGILVCYYGKRDNKNFWPASAVESTVRVPFEDMMLPIPMGWNDILLNRYGNDYMIIPLSKGNWRWDYNIVYLTGRSNTDHESK